MVLMVSFCNTHNALCQITRSHYQNAVTATRMDSSPLTPDADARLAEGNMLSPGAPEHTSTLTPPQHNTATAPTLMPPPREPSRPSSARTRGQQSSVAHSTSLLNEKNHIVREYLLLRDKSNRTTLARRPFSFDPRDQVGKC